MESLGSARNEVLFIATLEIGQVRLLAVWDQEASLEIRDHKALFASDIFAGDSGKACSWTSARAILIFNVFAYQPFPDASIDAG